MLARSRSHTLDFEGTELMLAQTLTEKVVFLSFFRSITGN